MNKQQIKFLVLFASLYLIFNYGSLFWIGLCAEGGFYWPFANKYLNFIQYYRHLLIWLANTMATISGLESAYSGISFKIIGKGGIKIVYECVGYGILSILFALAIAMPYKTIKEKLLFAGIGFLAFTLFNSLRLFLLSYFMQDAIKYNIDHHAVFNYLCYILIFIAMYYWINNHKSNHEKRSTT